MKKIIVIGCPGSGKSTFSRRLQERTGIPLFHLDRMNWNPDGTNVDRPVFQERLERVLREDRWILDGNYGATMEQRFRACGTVFFLDYPLEVCLKGIRERRGKPRPDMPWVEDPGEIDAEFLEFVKNYPVQGRPQVQELLRRYSQKEIHVFESRDQAEAFLKRLP